MTPQETQIGGTHYKDMAIQPVTFITANKLSFLEGCVIKRICRHRRKNGVEDLRKAIHEIELMIDLEYGEGCEVDADTDEAAMDATQLLHKYEMYERLNSLHCEFLERLMRIYPIILKDEIDKHQKERVEIITNTPKPRTATENRDANPLSPERAIQATRAMRGGTDLTSITGSGWHNPENVTQEQLGEGYRFLAPWEVDGMYRGIADMWCGDERGWDGSANGDCTDFTYRVPASTPIPPKL